jgi:uncharacterized protein (TIGR02996 family)
VAGRGRRAKPRTPAPRPQPAPVNVELAAAIAAAPDDLALQSIYADALLERGGHDATRGELVQLALGKPSKKAAARTAALLASFEQTLAGRGITGLQFAGGFARGWTCSSDDFASFASEVFGDEPLLHDVAIELAHKDALLQLRTVIATPQLARVRRLTIIGHHQRTGRPLAPGLALLIGSPHWPRLQRLALPCCSIGNAGVKQLAASPSVAALEELDLTDNDLLSAGVIALARSTQLRQLRWLKLDGNKPGEAGVKALAASAHITQLAYLSAGRTWLPRTSYAPIEKRFPALELVQDHTRYR